jgi:hypothetical protein
VIGTLYLSSFLAALFLPPPLALRGIINFGLRRQLQRGAHTAAESVDGARCHRAEQAVAPALQLGGREELHRLRQQH